jgi:hypothetical protein
MFSYTTMDSEENILAVALKIVNKYIKHASKVLSVYKHIEKNNVK